MVVQIKGVSQGSAKFLSRTSIGKATVSDSWYAKLDTTTTDVGNGVAVDSSGNVYIVGSTNSDTDVIILKYDKTGSLVWQRKLSGASSTDVGQGIAVDNLGNVYIVGYTNNAITTDILIAKYNTSGTLLWQTTLAGSSTDAGFGIAVDSSGNVYITAYTFNGSNDDIITAKYDTNGNILWQRKLVSNEGNSEDGAGIAVDSSGNVYIAGMFVVGSTWDILIAKYTTSGTIQWQRRLAGAGTDAGNGIAVDGSGNVYITGYSNAASNIIIAKYDTNGNISSPNGWQRRLEGGYSGFGIAVDSSGNAYITGAAWNGSNFDILIAKYNSSGVIQWQRTLASSSNDYGFGIALDSSGTNVYIAGKTGTNILIAKLPADGSIVNPTYTGKLKLIHSASSLSESAGGLTPSTPTLADSAGTLDSFKCDLYSSDPALTSAIVTSEVPVSSTSSLTSTSQIQIQTINNQSSIPLGPSTDIKFDSSGNYYVSGSVGNLMLIVKYNSSGTLLWQKSFGSGEYSAVRMIIDSSNNLYIAGYYKNGFYWNALTIKYDSNGNIIWRNSPSNPNYSNTQASDICIDSSANVYVVGYNLNSNLMVLYKYSTSGSLVWRKEINSTNGNGIAVDSSNNLYVTGRSGLSGSYDIPIIKFDTNGSIVWQRTLASGGDDIGNGIVLDNSNNVYIVGKTLSNTIIAKYDTDGVYKWQRTLNTSYTGDEGKNIAFDSNNNKIYIVGTGAFGMLIAKYDTNGNYEWQRTLKFSANTTYGMGITLNSSGNVYIAGVYANASLYDTIIAKIPSDGGTAGTYGLFTYTASSFASATSTLVQSTPSLSISNASVNHVLESSITSASTNLTYNSQITIQTLASAGTDVGNGIAVDSSGNYYITGSTGANTIIAKYNSSGIIQWQRTLAGASTNTGKGIATDLSGNVYITGHTYSGLTPHILIAKYDTSGTLLWQTNLSSINDDYGNAIAVDPSGNVYITGSTNNIAVANSSDAIIVKCNTLGVIQWQRKLVGTYDNYAYTIAVDSSGNAYIGGSDYEISGVNRNIHIIAKYNTSGTLLWQRKLDDNSGDDTVKGISVDSAGNVYITGTNDSSSSIHHVLIAKYDTNGTLTWQRNLASTSTDVGNAITVDSSGNSYITGNTNTDILIAKYDTNGTLTWQSTLASAGTDVGNGIVVDSSSTNVYITGSTGTDIIIAKIPNNGGTAGTYGSFTYTASSLTPSTSTYTAGTSVLTDSAGPFIGGKNAWISTFGASGSSLESGNGIALDSAKNIYTIGKTLHTSGTTDSLLVKYNTSGTMQWQRTLTGSNSNDSGNGIAIDSFDNIYTVGTTGSNANDIAISKYNTSGVIQWQAILGTSTAQVGNGIAVDSSGNVYISGSTFQSTIDGLIAKYNSSGTLQWQRRIDLGNGSPDYDIAYGMATDSSGNVYISTVCSYGSGAGTDMVIFKYGTNGNVILKYNVDMSNGQGIAVDSSDNIYTVGFTFTGTDILIVKYNSSGTFQWQRKLASASTDAGNGIAVDSSGNVYITGSTGTDIVIAKYNTSGTIQWQSTLTGTSTTDVGRGIKVDGDYIYITGSTSTGAKSLIAKLPNDGSYTGTYGSFTYATSSLTASTSTLSTGGASAVNSYTPTLTSSLIMSSTELNASSVNNYLR